MRLSQAYAALERIRTDSTPPDGEDSFLQELIELSKLATSQTHSLAAPEIEACLGDLREWLLSSGHAKLLLVYVSTNLGALKKTVSSKEANDLIQDTLVRLARNQSDLIFGFNSKYLLFIHSESPTAAQYPSFRNQSIPILCEDANVEASPAFEKLKLIAEIFSASKDVPIEFTLSFKYYSLSLNNTVSVDAQRTALDDHLKEAYYQLAMAVKMDRKQASQVLNVFNANESTLINHFANVRTSYARSDVSLEMAQAYLAKMAYAVSLTTDEHGLLFSSALLQNEFSNYENEKNSDVLKTIVPLIKKRLLYDHMFFRMNNRWRLNALIEQFERFEGLYYIFADVHDLELGVQKLDSQFHPSSEPPRGNINDLVLNARGFMTGAQSESEFLKNAYDIRTKSEELLNKWFEPLADVITKVYDTKFSALYLNAADQAEGFVQEPDSHAEAFRLATQATGGQMTAGIGLVKIQKDDTFAQVHKRAEFCVDVTKLFKGTATPWEQQQIWQEEFSSEKAEFVLLILESKILKLEQQPGNGIKLLERVVIAKDWWRMHLPKTFIADFNRLLARIYAATIR